MRYPAFLGVSLALAAVLAAEVPADGLLGRWTFAEKPPVVRAEGGRPLVLSHVSTRREPGGAVSLVCDGFEVGGVVDERVPLQFTTGGTLAIWVWPTRERGQEPVFGRPNPNPSWTTPVTGLQLVDGCPVFGLYTPQRKLLVEGPPLAQRAWSLVIATADGSQVTLYVNGRKVPGAVAALRIGAS